MSVTSTGRCGGPISSKRTRQLHQRGHGTLRNGRRSKLRVTHSTRRVAENLGGLDSHVSTCDVDSAAKLQKYRTKRTCQLHQRGVVVGPRGSKPSCVLTYCNGTKRTRQLHQRGVVVGPLFEIGTSAHGCSLIVVDGAADDVHSSLIDVDTSSL